MELGSAALLFLHACNLQRIFNTFTPPQPNTPLSSSKNEVFRIKSELSKETKQRRIFTLFGRWLTHSSREAGEFEESAD